MTETMKKIYLISIIAIATSFAATAQMRTSYFMEGSTFRTDMNPALAPTRGYINFPALGGIGIGMNNNYLSVSNFLYPTDNGTVTFLNNAVDKKDFLRKLPRNNTVDLDGSYNLLGFGGHSKRYFWAFGLNLKGQTNITIPKQFFSLITTLGQGNYDMSGMNIGVNSYLEAYLGAAIPIRDFITVGFRVKGLVGLAQTSLTVDKLYVNVTDKLVEARMSGHLRGNSILSNSGYPVGEKLSMDDVFDIDHISADRIKSGGAAVDLGIEVRLLDDHLRVSAAVTDLGFICWNKATTFNADARAGFLYEGYDFDAEEVKTSSEDFEFTATKPAGSYTKRLNMSLNFGAEYAILRNRISFGLLSHTKIGTGFSYTELTASANFKPVNWLTATVSHTFLNHNRPGVFGFALNIHPRAFNLFIGTDFIDYKYAKLGDIPIPVNMKSMNMYVGLGFSLGRAKYSKAYKDDVAAGRVKVKNRNK